MEANSLYVRTIIFGITDSLVSMVGLLAGINAAGASLTIIALTGIVYAFVEAFSMAVGNFLSEKSAEEYENKALVTNRTSVAAAVVMFITFVLVALIPLAPYLIFASHTAFVVSVLVSIFALFLGGAMGARISHVPVFWPGARMALLGGAAIAIGVFIGSVMPAA